MQSVWQSTAPSQVETPKQSADRLAFVLEMAGLIASVHASHWAADTRTNQHAALGMLYDSLDDLLDRWVEAHAGRTGRRDMGSASVTIKVHADKDLIEALRSAAKPFHAEAPDLDNIAADMEEAINKAAYLLMI